MQPLEKILEDSLAEWSDQPGGFCAAFSGGRDSTVLLHLLARIPRQVSLRAIHVNHGLHPDAAAWAEHCKSVAAGWGIPVSLLPVEVAVPKAAGGLEAAAREARYAALRECLREGEWLFTAHHADDQLETVLLRLMRGGGPAGIAGIRRAARFGKGSLVRPLLRARASELADYARRHGLKWIEDPSNRDEGLDRNYLRRQVVPRLQARWPAAADTATRSAGLADEAALLLEDLAQIDSAAVIEGDTSDLAALGVLSARRQRNLVRWFLHSHDMPPPSAAALAEGLGQLLDARADAAPRLSWASGELRRYRDRAYLLRCHPDQEAVPGECAWDGRAALELGSLGGRLSLRQAVPAGPAPGQPPFTVRFRRGGERLLQHGQHVSLKTLFQDGGVVPWMRAHVPLVFRGDELLSVGGLWYAEDSPGRAARDLEFQWEPRERVR